MRQVAFFTTSIPSNCFALLIATCAMWGCVEDHDHIDGFRASDSSNGIPENSDPNEQIPATDEDGCHGIYAQGLLPEFDLTIDSDEWDDLVWEWNNGAEQHDKGLDPDPYHPLEEFRYGEITIKDAQIRLRGNPDYWNKDDKLQFQVTFNRTNENGHFLGLERLAFDAATANRHMLRDRLALAIMRDMGVMAPCANNARLNINGEYYGIFTNVEKLDEVFLARTFEDPSGDLWKRQNWQLETNKKKKKNDQRLQTLKKADELDELDAIFDIETALKVYAAEAILPDSDGGWAGGYNFYVYDDPKKGKFVLLPWDLDSVFERFDDGPKGEYPDNPDPVVWHKKKRFHGRPWYDLALDDEDWFWYYIDTLEMQFEAGYQIDVLLDRINTWTDQIEESVLEDENKPWSNKKYYEEVDDLREYVQNRHDWLVEWFECWENGGQPDKKGYCKD